VRITKLCNVHASKFELAFQNGLEYRNFSDFKRSYGNVFSILCINLLRFGPVTNLGVYEGGWRTHRRRSAVGLFLVYVIYDFR